MNPESSLQEVKSYLRENWSKGTHCPACNQFVKRYNRPLHSTMALTLIRLYHLCRGNDAYLHVKKIVEGISDTGTNDFSKLRYWDLIEEMPKDSLATKTKTSGHWRITAKGIDFVLGNIKIPSRIILYNKTFMGFDGDDIDIRGVIRNEFDYQRLMNS